MDPVYLVEQRQPSFNPDLEKAITFLERLVNIDSSTENARGVELVQQQLANRVTDLGFQTQWLTQSSLPYGPFLQAEYPGRTSQYITLVSHADTVLKPHPFHRLDAQTAVGSGVIDNKGGLTVALLGLELFLRQNKKPKYGLRIVSSPNEEVGSIGFLEALRACASDSILGLGFEPALENGSIIQSRRGNRWYHIKIKGKEAHAGRSYGEHVNAAHELAFKIHQMQKLTNYKKHISVNVGALTGGRDKFNVVCGHAEAKIDVRFTDFDSRERLHRKIEKILKHKKHASVCGRFEPETSYEIVDDCPPFSSSARSQKLIGHYLDLIQSIEDRAIHAENAGGAGDVNYLSRESIVVLDGLGPVGGHMHTMDEFIYLPSLWTRAWAVSELFSWCMEKWR